jgi:hypothetical protein
MENKIVHRVLKVRPADPPKTEEQIAYNNWYKKMMTDPVYGFSAKAPFDPYKSKGASTMKKGRKSLRSRRSRRS